MPASTLKVITAASALELLGKDFRYKTTFAWQKKGEEATLLIRPSGDPTFGSWRWPATREEVVLKGLAQAISKLPVNTFDNILVDNKGWSSGTIPAGWLWQDIGNYYGAGAARFNWRENQYDVILRSGKRIGDPVSIVKTVPEMAGYNLTSEVTSAAAGSGDSAYIYFPLHGTTGTIRGTIPLNRNAFEISGAMPDPAAQFAGTLQKAGAGIRSSGKAVVTAAVNLSEAGFTPFHTVTSPPLDSIVYWLNRKSVNLYAEALVKTMAVKYAGVGATKEGTGIIRNFWKQQGIPEEELNLVDGSGLSPVNRVTAHALVRALQHSRKQPWFNSFYDSLPLYNGMKMKSGTMQGVKGYCGYYRDKAGNDYVFAFLVNNYSGSSASLTRKMYQVLDALK